MKILNKVALQITASPFVGLALALAFTQPAIAESPNAVSIAASSPDQVAVQSAGTRSLLQPPAGMRLLHDNGQPDGVEGLSHFEGSVSGDAYDRVIVDDFVLGSDSLVGGARICGIWFDSTGCETTFDGFRIRFFADDEGEPVAADPFFDTTATASCEETGASHFDRPEVCYTATFDGPALAAGETHWLGMQATGTLDNFFHLTSGTGLDNLIGAQAHLQGNYSTTYPPPEWAPIDEEFSDAHDLTFQLFGFPAIWDNGRPDGEEGLSNFEGVISEDEFDRKVADDFSVAGVVSSIRGVQACGVWFDSAGCSTAFDALEVRVYADDAGSPVADDPFFHEQGEPHCRETGDTYFSGRPEVCYSLHIDMQPIATDDTNWIVIRPIGTTDNFFQLTSATGSEELTLAPCHVQGNFDPEVSPPDWAECVERFAENHDASFRLFGPSDQLFQDRFEATP